MRARVKIPFGGAQKVLMVTERAIGNEQGRKYVYVVNDQDHAVRRNVTLDRVINGLQVVKEGLQPEDWVIVNGIQRVRDGMKVEKQAGPMPDAPKKAEQTPAKAKK
jgi:multidrug efflux pump subunit AcrA (membrane-fusion protein)